MTYELLLEANGTKSVEKMGRRRMPSRGKSTTQEGTKATNRRRRMVADCETREYGNMTEDRMAQS